MLPIGNTRFKLLARLGALGPLSLIAVATICGALVALFLGLTFTSYVNGVWFRAAVPFALVVLLGITMLGITMLGLRREHRTGVGERAILPRRRWHTFAPRAVLTIVGG